MFNNALKARLRDPLRKVKFLDFFTKEERNTLLWDALGDPVYERWLLISREIETGYLRSV